MLHRQPIDHIAGHLHPVKTCRPITVATIAGGDYKENIQLGGKLIQLGCPTVRFGRVFNCPISPQTEIHDPVPAL